MNQGIENIINKAVERLTQATGMKVVYLAKPQNKKNNYPHGLIRIAYQKIQWFFAVKAKKRMTRSTVAIEKTQPEILAQDYILFTEYVTPPIADLMKETDQFFMDTAGNGYINKPPLYIFIKGNKLPESLKTAPTKRLFKPAGLKVVFALLNIPEMVNLPYRQIAKMTGVALGTVDWIFRDLKEMGFLIKTSKRTRKMTNVLTLIKRWVEVYPDQLRPKIVIERFHVDQINWWKDVRIMDYDACWGGEVAAAKLTKQLKPEKITIYANETPMKLVIEKKLRKATDGNVEILMPFWKFNHNLTETGIVPQLLVYADLMATGDDRNIETAGIIYDNYLSQLDRKDR
ncbi:MAG: hypothetical protein GY874_11480 [Desulfobacteraceae bacterium]|nr:hypothetical protein [Desulfobacteraceae bacterium]